MLGNKYNNRSCKFQGLVDAKQYYYDLTVVTDYKK